MRDDLDPRNFDGLGCRPRLAMRVRARAIYRTGHGQRDRKGFAGNGTGARVHLDRREQDRCADRGRWSEFPFQDHRPNLPAAMRCLMILSDRTVGCCETRDAGTTGLVQEGFERRDPCAIVSAARPSRRKPLAVVHGATVLPYPRGARRNGREGGAIKNRNHVSDPSRNGCRQTRAVRTNDVESRVCDGVRPDFGGTFLQPHCENLLALPPANLPKRNPDGALFAMFDAAMRSARMEQENAHG